LTPVEPVDHANDEQRILDALAQVPPPAWEALFRAADAVAAEEVHATWEPSRTSGITVVDGEERPVMSVPYPVYSEAVEALRVAIGSAGLVVPFDWMAWPDLDRYRTGAGTEAAPVTDAVRLITAIVRSERFSDGSIEGALRSGALLGALGRLRRWTADEQA
jgi:hypothetical protein